MRYHSTTLAVMLSSGLLITAQNPNTTVSIRVTVADPLSRTVPGLEQTDFQIFENKVRQPIVSFRRGDSPVSVGIVVDTSSSMGGNLERTGQAVTEFLKTASADDEAFLIEFSNRPQLAVPLTHDFREIGSKLALAEPRGRTALIDGVRLALQTMEKSHNPHKVLLVISDGSDNSSRYNATEVKKLVLETDVQIYAIAVLNPGAARSRTPEEITGSEMLHFLTEPTGGRLFVAEDLVGLRDTAVKIGLELRDQYIVGYSPTNQVRDGKYRTIDVKLIPQPRSAHPSLHAFWRTGYFAPTQ